MVHFSVEVMLRSHHLNLMLVLWRIDHVVGKILVDHSGFFFQSFLLQSDSLFMFKLLSFLFLA